MRKSLFFSWIFCLLCFCMHAQNGLDSLRKAKDSTLRAAMHEDSLRIEKQFAEVEKMEKLLSAVEYPLLKADKFSGVVPVKNPDEIPDPNIDYKLLFELVFNNPDSMAKDINAGLNEISRVLNLHVASGIPARRIIPVIVVHGPALAAIATNNYYQKEFKINNPNLQLLEDIIKKAGAKFIACGQAMTFFDINKEDLLPFVKISLTAQTVLSHYQLKGYVLYRMAKD